MEHRRLGRSGMYVSEISYGNWLTHGSQVEADAATACVREALEVGITTFDTADVYAGTQGRVGPRRGAQGRPARVLRAVHQGLLADRPAARTTAACRASTSCESCDASLRRLQTDHIDLYQAHRFDHETPLDETLRAFDDLVRAGKVHYIGVSEWKAEEINRALKIADQMGLDRIVSNQPQYSALYRVIEAEVVPLCEREGIGQVVWSPIAQGVLTGKYLPGQAPPEGSRATDDDGGDEHDRRAGCATTCSSAVQQLKPLADDAGPVARAARRRVGAAQPERHLGDRRRVAARAGPRQRRRRRQGARRRPVRQVNEVLGGVVVTDPALTKSPATRP